MTYYRLLRDNKESGPYAEEELIAKGFKPYDLLWVEGKSAGWRYPSEIPAFKNFAPAIEEQPYDRFYKKQPPQKLFSEERTNHPSFSNVTARAAEHLPQQPPPVATVPPVHDRSYQSLPGRHIHVTLPSGNTVSLTTLVSKKDTRELKETEPVKQTDTRPTAFTTAVAKETTADNTYSHVKTIHEPVYSNRPAATGLSWGLIAAAFIGIATLVGLGIMIGLSISRDKNDMAFNEAIRSRSKQLALPGSAGVNNSKTNPGNVLPEAPPAGTGETVRSSPAAAKDLVQNAVVKSSVLPESTDAKDNKKLPAEKSAAENKTSAGRDEQALPVRPVAPPVNLEKHLSLTPNEFKTGAFGGISGLKYTLENSSRYPIESVEVEIDYIQANNKIYKTEKLLFKDISAGSKATIDAPSSNRGVKINSRIIKVNAKETLSNTTAKS